MSESDTNAAASSSFVHRARRWFDGLPAKERQFLVKAILTGLGLATILFFFPLRDVVLAFMASALAVWLHSRAAEKDEAGGNVHIERAIASSQAPREERRHE